jgi:heme/copper-type cytochrome/quinol oxidase subunit 2
MTAAIILYLVYAIGIALSYQMNRTEHEAESQVYTKGDRTINIFISIFSWAWVLVILIRAWVKQVGASGYWKKPVKQIQQDPE